jgi:ribonuclease Z
VQSVVDGFNAAYTLDAGYRVAHHGADIVPPAGAGMRAAPYAVGETETVVFEDGGLRITAFSVTHTPVAPAVGYRFDYGGRSVVISGDTARSATLERVAKGADVLVHEALAPNLVKLLEQSAQTAQRPALAHIFADIPGYHASPRDAAASARAANVRALVLTHIVPAMPTKALEPAFLDGATFDGPFWIGQDGDLVILPANTATIERKRLL